MLWQRFGRVARGQDAVGTAILLVEKKDTDEERVAKAERAAKRKKKGAGTKRKATDIGNREKAKRPALVDRSLNRQLEEISGDGENASVDNNTNGNADRELDAMVDPGRVAELAFKERPLLRLAVPWMTSSMHMLALHVEGSFRRCTLATIEHVSLLIDHLLCDSTTSSGCTRCAPKDCVICWDLCDPEFFEQYRVPLTKQTRIPAKSFQMTATSNNLKTAIFDWRRRHAIEKFGNLVVHRLGAKLL
jgi:ATP-dependent DNA helicase RecQ